MSIDGMMHAYLLRSLCFPIHSTVSKQFTLTHAPTPFPPPPSLIPTPMLACTHKPTHTPLPPHTQTPWYYFHKKNAYLSSRYSIYLVQPDSIYKHYGSLKIHYIYIQFITISNLPFINTLIKSHNKLYITTSAIHVTQQTAPWPSDNSHLGTHLIESPQWYGSDENGRIITEASEEAGTFQWYV